MFFQALFSSKCCLACMLQKLWEGCRNWLYSQLADAARNKLPPKYPPNLVVISLLVYVVALGHVLVWRNVKGQCKCWFRYIQIPLFWWELALLSQLLQPLVGVAVVWKQQAKQAQCSLWMDNKWNMLKYDLASSLENLLLLDVFKVSLLVWRFVFLSLQIVLNRSPVD